MKLATIHARENIIGHLIPAGSGIYRYAEIDIEPPAGYAPPPPRIEEVPKEVGPGPWGGPISRVLHS
jgi:hypothetical protein